jgi:hypothetical protein
MMIDLPCDNIMWGRCFVSMLMIQKPIYYYCKKKDFLWIIMRCYGFLVRVIGCVSRADRALTNSFGLHTSVRLFKAQKDKIVEHAERTMKLRSCKKPRRRDITTAKTK